MKHSLFSKVLASAGIALDTALVTLELTFFYLQQGRMDAVRNLARNLAPVFKVQGLPREALQLFRQAAEKDAVTRHFVLRFVAYLRRTRYKRDLPLEE